MAPCAIRYARRKSDLQGRDFPRVFPAEKHSHTFPCVPLHSPLVPFKTADILAFRAKPLILLSPAMGIFQAHNLKVRGSNPLPATNEIKGLALTG